MGLVDKPLEVGAAPARSQLDPRVEREEDPSQPIDGRRADVAGFDRGDERLRTAAPVGEVSLPPASTPAECAQNQPGRPFVHAADDGRRRSPADFGDRRHDRSVDHDDHTALIRGGVEGAGAHWLELGAGEGAFTLALADVLGAGGEIVALDRDGRALETARERVAAAFPGTTPRIEVVDFTRTLPSGPFDGVLAANSLHFVRERRPVLAAIRHVLAPGGRLVIVEYDVDRGNPWVPHPFSFETWRTDAVVAGFEEPRLIHRVRSRFLGAIYSAWADVRGPSHDDLVLHSRPHGEDREE